MAGMLQTIEVKSLILFSRIRKIRGEALILSSPLSEEASPERSVIPFVLTLDTSENVVLLLKVEFRPWRDDRRVWRVTPFIQCLLGRRTHSLGSHLGRRQA
ncbi:hypothetical protein FKM82_020906 [Ascaphus truei]